MAIGTYLLFFIELDNLDYLRFQNICFYVIETNLPIRLKIYSIVNMHSKGNDNVVPFFDKTQIMMMKIKVEKNVINIVDDRNYI